MSCKVVYFEALFYLGYQNTLTDQQIYDTRTSARNRPTRTLEASLRTETMHPVPTNMHFLFLAKHVCIILDLENERKAGYTYYVVD